MNPAIFCTKSAQIDGSAFAVLRNRDFAFELSRNTIGRLPMTPPVPRNRSLVPLPAAGAEISPDSVPAVGIYPCDTFDDYGRMMRDGFAFKYE